MKFMMRLIPVVMIQLLLSDAVAAESLTAPTISSEGVQVFAGLGSGVLFEKDNGGATDVTRLPLSGAVGVTWENWRVRAEYSSFRTSDGNGTVSVARDVESLTSWLSYVSDYDAPWAPVFSAGIGALRTNVETTLNQSMELSRGSWMGGFSLALGLQSRWTKSFVVRPELRYNSADNFKIKDARWGVFVNLELSVY